MFRTIVRPQLALLLALLAGQVAAQQTFMAPMDQPSTPSAIALESPLNALVRAGERLVAAGQRGHVLYSDDGKRWTQAQVPVSSDLTALSFPSASQGWAVGHEGVVLHSDDGGKSWKRQLDGRQIADLLMRHYGNPSNPDDPESLRLKQDAQLFASQGADKPLLDVWFEDELKGFVIGAFNLILHTEDGGKNWTPWLERIDNPRAMHLYSLRPALGTLFVVGEQGLVLQLDKASRRFTRVQVPYEGTLFGVLGDADLLLVYGLRGNAWRSLDGGRRWSKVDTGIEAGITGGLITADGTIVLVSQAGQVLRSTDRGASFSMVKVDRLAPNFAVASAAGGAIALAGLGGVRVQSLQ